MPYNQCKPRVTAIVLAAGLSTRMGGQPKPLLQFAGGTVIDRILSVLTGCPVEDIVVVTGHQREAVEQHLAAWNVRTTFNPAYASGEMLSSLQVGLQAAAPPEVAEAEVDAALVVLGDQPALEGAVVRSVVEAYRNGMGNIVIPSFEMRRGHPILIARKHWRAILELREGQTLRDHLQHVGAEIYHVAVNTSGILRDMDTPDEYHAELAAFHKRYEVATA